MQLQRGTPGPPGETGAELLALYAALLAHGIDIDAKSVAAMIPSLDTAWVSVAMRALETHGRLRRANERVVDFQGRFPLAAYWGNGAKGSADMMSLEPPVITGARAPIRAAAPTPPAFTPTC